MGGRVRCGGVVGVKGGDSVIGRKGLDEGRRDEGMGWGGSKRKRGCRDWLGSSRGGD